MQDVVDVEVQEVVTEEQRQVEVEVTSVEQDVVHDVVDVVRHSVLVEEQMVVLVEVTIV